jgi:hypothetical protein
MGEDRHWLEMSLHRARLADAAVIRPHRQYEPDVRPDLIGPTTNAYVPPTGHYVCVTDGWTDDVAADLHRANERAREAGTPDACRSPSERVVEARSSSRAKATEPIAGSEAARWAAFVRSPIGAAALSFVAIAGGMLVVVGMLVWNGNAYCKPGTSGSGCPKQLDLKGMTITSAGDAALKVGLIAFFVALLVGLVAYAASPED